MRSARSAGRLTEVAAAEPGSSLRELSEANFGLRFHHLGLAVRKPDSARQFLEGVGYSIGEAVFDAEQNVVLHMATHPAMPEVEIISPAESGRTPVDSLIARHKQGIVYHICFATADLAASVRAIEAAGLRHFCVSPPKPAALFDGCPVSFHVIDGFGLVEIVEQPQRVSLI